MLPLVKIMSKLKRLGLSAEEIQELIQNEVQEALDLVFENTTGTTTEV